MLREFHGKEGFGWSDERLFEAIHFDLLIRRALGLEHLTDGLPAESTDDLFKQRLYRYQVEPATASDNAYLQDAV